MDPSCQNCGAASIVQDEHEGETILVCEDCGFVSRHSDQLNLRNEQFGGNDAGPSGVRVEIFDSGALAGLRGLSRTGTNRAAFGTSSVHLRWMDHVNRLADRLEMSQGSLGMLQAWVRDLHEEGYPRSFSWHPLIGTAAYIVARLEQLPISLRDVADASEVEITKLAHCFRQVVLEKGLQIPPNNIPALVTRHVGKLLGDLLPPGSGMEAVRQHPIMLTAHKVLKFIQQSKLAEGRAPLTIAGTVIHMAIDAHVSQRKRRQWMLLNLENALHLPPSPANQCVRLAAIVAAHLKQLAPLIPHLPNHQLCTIVQHIDDILHLFNVLAKASSLISLPLSLSSSQPIQVLAQPSPASQPCDVQQLNLPPPPTSAAGPSGCQTSHPPPSPSPPLPHAPIPQLIATSCVSALRPGSRSLSLSCQPHLPPNLIPRPEPQPSCSPASAQLKVCSHTPEPAPFSQLMKSHWHWHQLPSAPFSHPGINLPQHCRRPRSIKTLGSQGQQPCVSGMRLSAGQFPEEADAVSLPHASANSWPTHADGGDGCGRFLQESMPDAILHRQQGIEEGSCQHIHQQQQQQQQQQQSRPHPRVAVQVRRLADKKNSQNSDVDKQSNHKGLAGILPATQHEVTAGDVGSGAVGADVIDKQPKGTLPAKDPGTATSVEQLEIDCTSDAGLAACQENESGSSCMRHTGVEMGAGLVDTVVTTTSKRPCRQPRCQLSHESGVVDEVGVQPRVVRSGRRRVLSPGPVNI